MSTVHIELNINATVKFNPAIIGLNIQITKGNASLISAIEVTTSPDTTIQDMLKELIIFIKGEMNQRLFNNLANSSENNTNRVNANIETNKPM